MIEFSLSRISFTKAAKYVFLKRTDVCHSWTSSPTFQESIFVQDTQIDESYKIKGCEATIDRKLKIVGQFVVERKDFTQNEDGFLFDNDLELVQVVEGKNIVVGRCHLQVRRVDEQTPQFTRQIAKSKVSTIKDKVPQTGMKSLNVSAVNSLANSKVVTPFNSARAPQLSFKSPRKQPSETKQNKSIDQKPMQSEEEIDSDFEMKSDDSERLLQNDCSIRFFIHGGTNFYLGSSFSVQLIWCDRQSQTHYIKDKILPQWAQSLVLLGNSEESILVNILDEKKNILQWTKFSLKNIRKLYPYHLKIVFREEYMGDRPVVYLSFMREDLPKFTILDKQIRLIVGYQGDNVRNPLQYLAIQAKKQLEIPTFFQLDLRKYGSFEQINKFIENFQIGDYNWNFFMPLETGKKEIVMFKSQLNKEMSLFLVSVRNWTQAFSNEPNSKRVQSVSIIEKRQEFKNILKQIYYHQQIHALGKVTQIYSETSLAEDKIKDTNTWRTLTKNYILRNNLLNNSIRNLEILRSQITTKGQELIKLKKILAEVKSINTTLKQKEKSTLILSQTKQRKQKLSGENFKITDIEMMLYEKQAELEFKKKRNQEMTQRMQSLNTMEEDTSELDFNVTKNAKSLLEQQQKIKLMLMVRKQLPKQRMIIRRLQQIFQKLEIDKNMNDLLKQEQEKLNLIREKKRQDLKRVYELLREKNKKEKNLKTKQLFLILEEYNRQKYNLSGQIRSMLNLQGYDMKVHHNIGNSPRYWD